MKKMKTRKPQTIPQASIQAQQRVFRQILPRLIERYEGQFVALYEGRVVGHSSDDEELAQRMFEKLGDAPFYIAKVEKEPTIYELPSPEILS